MNLTTLLLFIPACFALNMAPGPNNLLSLTNAKRYGVRTACLAGIGRLIAFVGMTTLAATGLATLLARIQALGWAKREEDSRVIVFSAKGEASLRAMFAVSNMPPTPDTSPLESFSLVCK
jgi:hypothetical protein